MGNSHVQCDKGRAIRMEDNRGRNGDSNKKLKDQRTVWG